MKIDYIIVGSGLAGIAFSEIAVQNNKSVIVIDNNSQNSSKIAGGLYNPVILKRFSEVWNAEEQLEIAEKFYSELEIKLQSKFDYKVPILRKFFSIEDQNNWFVASDKPSLSPFLSTQLISKQYQGIDAPFQYGMVLQTGYIETAKLIENYKKYLLKKKMLIGDIFDYTSIIFDKDEIKYKDITANHIIFAEGYGMHSNPYFKHLPLDGTKGELLLIKAPNLKMDVIINTSVFIMPLGNDLFKVGATYNWQDKDSNPTEAGKNELSERIKEILNCDFEIISHFAGVRPTVRDRKPLLGTHHEHHNIHILNGLGTRGVMLAPSMAKILFDHIENNKIIEKEINIVRYNKK